MRVHVLGGRTSFLSPEAVQTRLVQGFYFDDDFHEVFEMDGDDVKATDIRSRMDFATTVALGAYFWMR